MNWDRTAGLIAIICSISAITLMIRSELENWSRNSRKLVILESPYAGDVVRNEKYARLCLRDSLLRGEAPIASHLLYTQPGVLDDKNPEERKLGIGAGLAWGVAASKSVVYTDLGISKGMEYGIARAEAEDRTIEYRELSPTLMKLL